MRFYDLPGEGAGSRARPIQTVGRTGAWLDLALVVLIDDDSASGAEVLAAGLRDNGRAQLVGKRRSAPGRC